MSSVGHRGNGASAPHFETAPLNAASSLRFGRVWGGAPGQTDCPAGTRINTGRGTGHFSTPKGADLKLPPRVGATPPRPRGGHSESGSGTGADTCYENRRTAESFPVPAVPGSRDAIVADDHRITYSIVACKRLIGNAIYAAATCMLPLRWSVSLHSADSW